MEIWKVGSVNPANEGEMGLRSVYMEDAQLQIAYRLASGMFSLLLSSSKSSASDASEQANTVHHF